MFNWRLYPFVRLTIVFIIGILCSDFFELPFLLLQILLSVFAFVAIVLGLRKQLQSRWTFGILISLTLLLLGAFRMEMQDERKEADHFSRNISDEHIIIGTVYEMPETKNWLRLKLDIQAIGSTKDDLEPSSGNLLTYIKIDSIQPDIQYGDQLLLKTNILPTQKAKNPHAFDYSRYLHYKNIYYQAFVKANEWQCLERGQGNPVLQRVYTLRARLLLLLEKVFSRPENYAVGAAILLGYRGELSEELRNAYAETGAIHVLAVSGLHVGLIYILLSFLLKRFPSDTNWQRSSKAVISLSAIWLFALLTGSSASVLRASTMFSFIIIGDHLNRNNNIYNSIAVAAFCSLFYNPYLLKDVGFQLSYLAVLGIVYFQPKIYKLLHIEFVPLDYLWRITAVSFAAQIAVFPISLLYFHQFPLYFWLSSAVVIPAAFLILSSGILLFCFAPFIPIAELLFGTVLDGLITGVNYAILYIKDLPGGLLKGIWTTWYETLLLYGSIIAIAILIHQKRLKWLVIALGFLAVFLLSRNIRYAQSLKQKSLAVYHIARHTVIDFFDGQKAFSLQSEGIASDKLHFATAQNRWAKFSPSIEQIEWSSPNTTLNSCFFSRGKYIQFYNKRMIIIDKMPMTAEGPKIKTDYLLLHGNPKIQIEKLLDHFEFELLLWDASNSFWKIEKWRTTCETLKLPYYDISTQGALTYKIN